MKAEQQNLVYRVRFDLAEVTPMDSRAIHDMMDAIHRRLVTSGEGIWVVTVEGVLLFEAHVASRQTLEGWLAPITEHFLRKGRECRITVFDQVAEPLTPAQRNEVDAMRNEGKKLTRKFFFSIPAGAFLLSNCFTAARDPIFAESVSTVELRAQQWARIVAVGAAQRLCYVFRTEAESKQWLAGFWSR